MQVIRQNRIGASNLRSGSQLQIMTPPRSAVLPHQGARRDATQQPTGIRCGQETVPTERHATAVVVVIAAAAVWGRRELYLVENSALEEGRGGESSLRVVGVGVVLAAGNLWEDAGSGRVHDGFYKRGIPNVAVAPSTPNVRVELGAGDCPA